MLLLTLTILLLIGPALLVLKLLGALLYWPLRILGGLLSIVLILALIGAVI